MNQILDRRQLLRWAVGWGGALALASCGASREQLFSSSSPPNAFRPFGEDGPCIYDTKAWAAAQPNAAVTLLAVKPVKIIIHHTATANSDDFSAKHAFALARGIQSSHFKKGWIDSGQNFTISRGGVILESRHRSLEAAQSGQTHVQGAHCLGQNAVAIGIENEGLYSTVAPTEELYRSLVELCTWLCRQYGIRPSELYGHRDFNATECPGQQLYERLPQLRREVMQALGLDLRIWPTVKSGHQGAVVKLVQQLLRHKGQTLSIDSLFGPDTTSAVKAVQAQAQLDPDGLLGSASWEALVPLLNKGAEGEAVRAVQERLGLPIDGLYGPETSKAVRRFQQEQQLSGDGVVGPQTWLALVEVRAS